MNKLEEALLQHKKELLERQNIAPNGDVYFETSLGNGCIRVCMKISNNVFLDKGYFPKNFGYLSYDLMEKYIINFLKSARLSYHGPLRVKLEEIASNLFKNSSINY